MSWSVTLSCRFMGFMVSFLLAAAVTVVINAGAEKTLHQIHRIASDPYKNDSNPESHAVTLEIGWAGARNSIFQAVGDRERFIGNAMEQNDLHSASTKNPAMCGSW